MDNLSMYEFNQQKKQLKTQWENLKKTNASQKEKNNWKRKEQLELESNQTSNCWRVMTNREVEEYFSDY